MLSPAAGVIIQNKYLLETPLARGGMGSVWIASHRELAVNVAVKFMDPELAAYGGGARFEREAKAAAQLDSRHIVQIRDYGVAEGTPFLVMELLKGESLEQRLTRVRRMSLSETLSVLQQLAKGLRKAHDAGIIHRDLKPGNIFLAVADDEEVVKILDFGIAKFSHASGDANATRTGVVMGSVHYASPEQLRSSKNADIRSDLWSVGVILFRMLVGERPFKGNEIPDVIVKVCAEPIPAPRSIAPDLPPETDAFFLRALARNPAERFQTISELVEAFTGLVHSEAARRAPAPQPTAAAIAPPAPLTRQGAPDSGQSATLKLPVEETEQKTATWPNARKLLPSDPLASHDSTLRATEPISVTSHPSRAHRTSPRLAVALAAVSVLVLGSVFAGVIFFQVGSGEVAADSPSAASERTPNVMATGGLTSMGEAPGAARATSSTPPESSGVPASEPPVPSAATGPASVEPPESPAVGPVSPTTTAAPGRVPSSVPSVPKASPQKKAPTPANDRDVDLP